MISDEFYEGISGRVVFSDHFWSVVGREIAELLSTGGYFHQVASFSWRRTLEVLRTTPDIFGSYVKSVVVSVDGMPEGSLDAWLEELFPILGQSSVKLVLVTSDWSVYNRINDKTGAKQSVICA